MKSILIKKSYWIVLLSLFLSFHLVFPQNITYEYDNAGNRISRKLVTMLRSDVAEENEEVTTYMEVIEDLEIKIFPNPTNGIIYIELQNLSNSSLADIALYQLSGMLIDRKENIHFSTEFNITDQPAGIYILKIIAGDKQSEWKIIKE